MGLSIITPHFNDFEGIKQTHNCLLKQNSNQWEWIIVDDFSDEHIKQSLTNYFAQHKASNIRLIFNDKKTTGSICRNIGIEYSSYAKLVFLDSDDSVAEDFVSNRQMEVEDFIVFKNFSLIDEHGTVKPSLRADSNYLDCFLQAKFIWQTTAILWNKAFLLKIGKFNTVLKRLQDIELSIRALMLSTNYKVIDNKVDFFYNVVPIDISKKPVSLICESVNYLIGYMHDRYKLSKYQSHLVTGYYYLCVRYFNRSTTKGDIVYVQKSLIEFYKKKYMSYLSYLRAMSFIKLYKMNLISSDLFLRLNRRFYK